MSYTYRLHPSATQDYYEAFIWYEEQQKGLGEKFIKAVRQKIEAIAFRPEAYGSRNNRRFREARVDFFPYLIVFKIRKKTKEIFISSIHHTKRHPRKKYRK